jgi:hypothetical protein
LLAAHTIIPPSLIGRREPEVKTSSRVALLTGTAEDHILLTGAQIPSQPSSGPIKVLDGLVVRAEGIDMGRYELAIRGCEHIRYIGVFSNNSGKSESEARRSAAPAATGLTTPWPPVSSS